MGPVGAPASDRIVSSFNKRSVEGGMTYIVGNLGGDFRRVCQHTGFSPVDNCVVPVVSEVEVPPVGGVCHCMRVCVHYLLENELTQLELGRDVSLVSAEWV